MSKSNFFAAFPRQIGNTHMVFHDHNGVHSLLMFQVYGFPLYKEIHSLSSGNSN